MPTTIRFLRTLVLITAALALPAGRSAAETVTVSLFGTYFGPREIVIHPGDTVRWVWQSGTHSTTEGTDGLVNGNELWHSALTSAVPSYQFTFTPAILAANPRPGGRYDYFCQPHFAIGMTGAIIVADPPPGAIYCAGDGTAGACPCGNTSSAPTGCRNSDGAGGRLRAKGVASVAADTLQLWATGISESSNLLFFQGTTRVNGGAGTVFGDGLRCAGGTLTRLGVKAITFGHAEYPVAGDLAVSVRGSVPPGATRTYQAFYRDLPSTCTGAQFNTTNGYSVTWLP